MRRTRLFLALSALGSSMLVAALLVPFASPAEAVTATGRTAVRTQLQASPKFTGGTTLTWIPANTTLTLQCLAVGEKAYGAVASADPYYYRTTYASKTGYVADADLYTSADATKLNLTYCSIPAEPGKPVIGAITSSSVALSWADRSNNETSFRSQYSTDGGSTWKAGPTVGANATKMTVTGLSASRAYTFQIGAANNKGTKWSAYAYATTAKATPAPAVTTNGNCNYRLVGGTSGDYVKDIGKGEVRGTYTVQGRGIRVCGPRPGLSHLVNAPNKYGVSPYADSVRYSTNKYKDPQGRVFEGLDGYQCTELTVRWLYLRDGVRYGANGWGAGKDFVNRAVAVFGGTKYRSIGNGSHDLPREGDVISFAAVSGNPYGHVAVVSKSSSVNSAGDGSFTLIEENSPTATRVVQIRGWRIAAQGGAGTAVNWLRKR